MVAIFVVSIYTQFKFIVSLIWKCIGAYKELSISVIFCCVSVMIFPYHDVNKSVQIVFGIVSGGRVEYRKRLGAISRQRQAMFFCCSCFRSQSQFKIIKSQNESLEHTLESK